MRQVAGIATTQQMTAAAPLFAESAPAALWLLLSGEIALRGSGGEGPVAARGGDIIGSLSTMAGRPLGLGADVVRGGIALRISRDDLFDMLGERPELLRQMFEGMFRLNERAPAAA
jgi:CRP-like cAMP-binding protein